MATNSAALSERFAYCPHYGQCATPTQSGDQCYATANYGAIKGTLARPEGYVPTSEIVVFCHRHATKILVTERGY